MGEQRIVLNIPETVLLAEKTDAETFARELRMLAAVKLYEMGRLSSGRAAELAGPPPHRLRARSDADCCTDGHRGTQRHARADPHSHRHSNTHTDAHPYPAAAASRRAGGYATDLYTLAQQARARELSRFWLEK